MKKTPCAYKMRSVRNYYPKQDRENTKLMDSQYETAADQRQVRSFIYKKESLIAIRIRYEDCEPAEREIELFRSSGYHKGG